MLVGRAIMKASVELAFGLPMSWPIGSKRGEQERVSRGTFANWHFMLQDVSISSAGYQASLLLPLIRYEVQVANAANMNCESRFASDCLGEQVSSTAVSYVCLTRVFPYFLSYPANSLFLPVLRLKIPHQLGFQYLPLPPLQEVPMLR